MLLKYPDFFKLMLNKCTKRHISILIYDLTFPVGLSESYLCLRLSGRPCYNLLT